MNDRKTKLNESGQGLTEYLILLILIAVTCIGVVQTLGSRVEEKLKKAHEKINSVSVAGTGAS